MNFYLVTLTLQVDLLFKKMSWTMTFDLEGLLIVAIYIWLSPESYVVFLTTLVVIVTLTLKFDILKTKIQPGLLLLNQNR